MTKPSDRGFFTPEPEAPPKVRAANPPTAAELAVQQAQAARETSASDLIKQALARMIEREITAMAAPPPSGAPATPAPPPYPARKPPRIKIKPDGSIEVPCSLTIDELRSTEPTPEQARRFRLLAEAKEEAEWQKREDEYKRRHGNVGLRERYDTTAARMTVIPEQYDEKTGHRAPITWDKWQRK
jgi:hypothetical protein